MMSPSTAPPRLTVVAGALYLVAVIALAVGLGVGYAVPSTRPSSTPPPPPPPSVCEWSDYRLPSNAVPQSYSVRWAFGPFGSQMAVAGSSVMDVRLVGDSSCVLVHAGPSLAVASVTAQAVSAAGALLGYARPVAFTADMLNERLVLAMPFAAPYGSVVRLAFSFAFPVATDNIGLYVSTYENDVGATVTALATQFQDEPSLKAVFSLTVEGVPVDYTALSNMPVSSDVARTDGTRIVAFSSTPRMSTYLLALVVGKLVSVTVPGVGSGRIDVTAWAVDRANNVELLGFSATAAAKLIPFFDASSIIDPHSWFGDIVTPLFWDSLWLNEGFANLMEVVATDALAPQFGYGRQFFTNTVSRTLKTDAFADVQVLTQRVDSSAEIGGAFSAISYDKGASVLAMVRGFLDARGEVGFIPPGAFFAGVSKYLRAHAFGNAKPSELWAALADASGSPALVAGCITYEMQPGFALVTVEWEDAAVGEATGVGVLRVSQGRFFMSPASARRAAATGLANVTYWVPFGLKGRFPGVPRSALPAANALALASSGFSSATWAGRIGTQDQPFSLATDGFVKVGLSSSFYARVNYPPRIWAALGTAASASASGAEGSLSANDRSVLLDDIFSLAFSTAYRGARGEGTTTATALAFAEQFVSSERSFEVISVFLANVGTLTTLLVPDVPPCVGAAPGAGGCSVDPTTIDPFTSVPGSRACFDAENAWARAQIAGAVVAVSWSKVPGEAPLAAQLRTLVLNAASYYGDAGTIATAAAKWAAFRRNGTELDPNIASIVISSVMRWGGASVWTEVRDLFLAAETASEAIRYLYPLANTRVRPLLQQTLELALSDSVRTGDKVMVIALVAANPWGKDLAWAFIKSKWATLFSLYGGGLFDTSTLVATPRSFVSEAWKLDVEAFFVPGSQRAADVSGAIHDYNGALETIERAALWRSVDLEGTCRALLARAA